MSRIYEKYFFFCSEEIHQGLSRKALLPLSISKTVQSAGEDQTYFGTVGYFCLLGPGRLLKQLLLDMATSLFYFRRRISRERNTHRKISFSYDSNIPFGSQQINLDDQGNVKTLLEGEGR